MVNVCHLTKKFNGFTAVDDISFEVAENEIFAFLGPNGAGKTTTIKILATILKPTSGTAKVNGFDVSLEKEKVRRSFGIIFTAISSGIEIIWDREFGFLKETLVAPVPRYKIMLGKTLGGATVATFQGFITLFLCFVIGFRLNGFWVLFLALFCMFLIGILFTAMGITIASNMADMHGFQLIINFLVMPIFFLSGALFPLQGLPKSIQIAAAFDPLSYGVDSLRFTLSNITHFGIWLDFLVLFAAISIFLAMGSYFFERVEI